MGAGKTERIQTSDRAAIKPYLDRLYKPADASHKGQNGKLLVIGGSELFHASPIWAAEAASYYTDMIHFSSTRENNEILTAIKKNFRAGIVVKREDIPYYVNEDDATLVGPGMVRSESAEIVKTDDFKALLAISDEAIYARSLTHHIINHYPQKRFVFDAGVLQMMSPEWLQKLETPSIITPHQLEFSRLFGKDISSMSFEEKVELVTKTAAENKTIILLKAVDDIISNGQITVVITGGNQGLTKGGTGDVLAGLVAALYTKNDPIVSAVLASYLLKSTADSLFTTHGYWYNTQTVIDTIPTILKQILYN